jgi:hypothetical protein
MAILFADNFDRYNENMLDMRDVWRDIAQSQDTDLYWHVSTVRAATGTQSAGRGAQTEDVARLRRYIGQNLTTVGLGFKLYLRKLPTRSRDFLVAGFEDQDNGDNIAICVDAVGAIRILRGHHHGDQEEPGTFLYTTNPLVKTGRWHHFEIKVFFDGSVGYVVLRLDEKEVVNLQNINTVASLSEKYSSSGESAGVANCAAVSFFMGANNISRGFDVPDTFFKYVDDVILWDTTGSYNNDFMGDHRVEHKLVTADTAQADWGALSGNAFDNINDLPQLQHESSFIYAGTPGSPDLVSEFEVENLTDTTGTVAAVIAVNHSRKDTNTDAPKIQTGIVSGGAEIRGPLTEVNGAYNYYEDVFETDPSTGLPFTPTQVNNVKLQISRAE